MLVLVTYDVSVSDAGGRKRLRQIAKTCLDYGVRVQNSVFECELDPAQWAQLRHTLLEIFNVEQDSLRFYFLGKHGYQKVEHVGAKVVADPLRAALIV